MFENLDRRPTLIERLGLHLAVVAALTGLFGGALAIGDVARVAQNTASKVDVSEASQLASFEARASPTDPSGQLR